MTSGRLPTAIEVAALIRRVTSDGGHAAVLRKGDADRGSLLLLIASRGEHVACLERLLASDGYRWNAVGPAAAAEPEAIRDFLARRTRFDEDLWAVELDIADPQRLIAEIGETG